MLSNMFISELRKFWKNIAYKIKNFGHILERKKLWKIISTKDLLPIVVIT